METVKRQDSYRGYFTINVEILALTDVSKGDYAYSTEDLLVWIYHTSWYETDQIVPDQVTSANNNSQSEDSGTDIAGIQTDYARGDLQYPLNITITIPISDLDSGSVGTSNYYAKNDHSYLINITLTIPSQDSASGSFGSTNYYARNDHSHPINAETNASNIPVVNGVGANGTSAFYARQDHVHPQQLTYDGNVTATKFIKIGGTNNDILLANGDIKAIFDIDRDSVKKIGKTLQVVQRLLRYGATAESFAGVISSNIQINPTAAAGYDDGLRIAGTIEDTCSASIELGCNRISNYGAIQGQWVIAGTGAASGASNGSVIIQLEIQYYGGSKRI
ncbi:MAG: hypothetical protein EZS28_028186 [Streblomastix strix]|uniref:Uncharacterized protein n=1 Tax=Streblomastix strix TaxID=222440 RepID=A0A5J4V2K8_9EUKA|nr:MAG: hypothetical protein EZS28_028186 [Streblomastix strix]